MDQPDPQFDLPQSIRTVLAAVRARIRAYVWIEGLAILVAVLGCAFWLGIAMDWAFEPTAATRKIGLIAIGLVVAYIAYRYLFRRAFVRISDSTAAMLLERRFPALKDHLLTAVNVAATPSDSVAYHPQLVAETARAADAALAEVQVSRVFKRGPLVRAILTAAVFVVSVGLFAFLARDVFGFWLQRIALTEKPWPRRVHLEVVGFPANAAGERTHKLAQDDDFELLVHAQTGGYEAPDEVQIRFRLADGRRGRDTLIRVGDAAANASDFQLFRYEFKHVPGDMEFDVVGGDDRVEGLHLQVVDRPELYAIELECIYPEYLKRETRRIPVTGGMRIPEGTKLIVHASSTKPLTAARVHGAKDQHETSLKLPEQQDQKLRWDYGKLIGDDVLMVSVTDIDGVACREPYRVSLAAVKDELPQVAVRLAGISSAVTPDAVLPFVGKVTDDYGLERAWFEYQVDGAPAVEVGLAIPPGGEPSLEKIGNFDLRATDPKTGQRLLALNPKQRLTLSLKATDRFDLTDEKRAGSSQQFTLEIVTAADLLALLERRELALRQRFEAIYEKLTDTRNLLSRVEADDTANGNTAASGATSANGEAAAKNKPTESATSSPDAVAASAQRSLSRRRLRVAGSLQNVVQSADEVKGVAEAFDDLSQEIKNNRIDNPDLQSRLGEQIARPLHQIGEQRMPELVAQLKLVEERLEDPKATETELKKAIAQADAILVSMRQVLDKMLELETYNEVVSLLRGIITDQDEISRRTKERQKDKLKSLFEN